MAVTRTGAASPVAVAASAGAIPLIAMPRVAAQFVEVDAGATSLTNGDTVLARDDTCAVAAARGLWNATLGPLAL